MRKTPFVVLVGALGLALGACSDEPSEAAMRQAVMDLVPQVSRQEAAETFARTGRRSEPLSITSFRKIDCVTAQPQSGHQCRYVIGVNGIDKGEHGRRFVRGPDGTLTLSE